MKSLSDIQNKTTTINIHIIDMMIMKVWYYKTNNADYIVYNLKAICRCQLLCEFLAVMVL